MVPGHSCHIYGIWTNRSKKVWGYFKAIHWGGNAFHKRGILHMEGVFSLYNTAALKFFIISFTAG